MKRSLGVPGLFLCGCLAIATGSGLAAAQPGAGDPVVASAGGLASVPSPGPATAMAQNPGTTVSLAASWTPDVAFDRHLFPSLIIVSENPGFKLWELHSRSGISIKGNPDGWLTADVRSGRDGCPFKLVVSCRNLMEESVLEGVLENGGERYRLIPKIAWNFDALYRYKQQTLENLTFELFLDGKPVGRQLVTVQVHGTNDCPMYFSNQTEAGTAASGADARGALQDLDTSWMMAAFVNEDHPWIDKILKEALETEVVESFDGYQQGETDAVLNQVFAIWYVMQRKGMKYSSIHPTAAVSEKITSQHVRFLDEAIENTQANCVDGSVLFASILRKIGIHPYLVSTPDHVFLAFDLAEEGDEIAVLETTRMGELSGKPKEDATGWKILTKAVRRKKSKKQVGQEDSWTSFSGALEDGEAEFDKIRKKLGLRDPDYLMIDIAEARRNGIAPISARK